MNDTALFVAFQWNIINKLHAAAAATGEGVGKALSNSEYVSSLSPDKSPLKATEHLLYRTSLYRDE